MTTPHPRRAFDDDAAHADLLAAVAHVLPTAAGLAQIIGGAPTDRPLDPEPGRVAHTRLLIDLAAALDTDRGRVTILAAESGLAGVVDNMAAALDADRGLAAILATSVGDADVPVGTTPDLAGLGTPASADGPPITRSTLDDLSALHLAPADQRLQLRAGLPSRAAHDALRDLENIRMALAGITPGSHPLDSPLDTAVTVFDRQRTRIAQALTVMAQALPVYRHPSLGTSTSTDSTLFDRRASLAAMRRPRMSSVKVTDPTGWWAVGRALSRLRKIPAGAKSSSQEHAEHGAIGALLASAQKREQAGDIAGAEDLYREAALEALAEIPLHASGESPERVDDPAGAQDSHPQVADGGDVGTLLALAEDLEEAGDIDGGNILRALAAHQGRDIAGTGHLYNATDAATRHADAVRAAAAELNAAAERAAAAADLHAHAEWTAAADQHADAERAAAAAELNAAAQSAVAAAKARYADAGRAATAAAADRAAVTLRMGALYAFAEFMGRTRGTSDAEAVPGEVSGDGDADAVSASAYVPAEGDTFGVPSQFAFHAVAQSASLLRQTADELAALYGELRDRPPLTAGTRLLHGCAHHVDELTATVQQLWAVLSDFCGADLRAVADVPIEGLDEVRWSDGTAGTEPTRWPAALVLEVQKHSRRVEDLEGVWEIGFGAAISPGRS